MLLAPLLAAFAFGGAPTANLAITVWPQGQRHASRSWTLHCNPDGGTLLRAAAACRRLSAFADNPFAPTTPNTICTLIYGGPQVARVRGSFRARRLLATFARRNGCEINRWDRLAFLFPARL
jgi:hypothetical protein